MDSVRIKAYAKLNLTLFVTGVHEGYHMLDSLVTSVDLYDLIAIKKRKDKLISIEMHGQGSESIPYDGNNAVKAAEAFVETYGTCGADITVYKNIPSGLGMGGSSADAAGVLNGLAALYKTDDYGSLKKIADGVGSDAGYMLRGGYALLKGRGDVVTPIDGKLKLNFLLLAPRERVSTAQCFKAFDGLNNFGGDSAKAVSALTACDKYSLAENTGNALFAAAKLLSPEVQTAFDELSSFNPLAVNMTGSGSGVYAIFENAEFCAYAKSRYRGKFQAYCLKTK